MSVTQSRYWCATCNQYTLHERHLFGAGWGCLLTILTAGIFIPIWLLISLCETLSNPPRCQKCGEGHTSIVQAITTGFLLLMIGVGAVGWLMMDLTKKQSAAIPPAPPIPAAAEGEPAKSQPAPGPAKPAIAVDKVPAKPTIAVDKVPAKPAIAVDKSVADEVDAIEKERNDAIHARTLLSVGRNWEKNERPELALKTYRELVTKYPNSAQAKTAKERIKVLGLGAPR
ncbi:MAG: hypothetical protein WA746_28505 [Isosphaeraceae bacterium]